MCSRDGRTRIQNGGKEDGTERSVARTGFESALKGSP